MIKFHDMVTQFVTEPGLSAAYTIVRENYKESVDDDLLRMVVYSLAGTRAIPTVDHRTRVAIAAHLEEQVYLDILFPKPVTEG